MALIISEKKYDSIKSALATGLTQAQVAQQEFCSQSTVSKVKNSKNYKGYRESITQYNKNYNTQKVEAPVKEGFFGKLKEFFK